ncbi:tRNA modification GTPase [Flavobacterium suzhouense]|uniref:tRNA modification GTPase n=1 Tax=Flavobacterium suzhouense TaxID=1529638 RepID=A0ABW5NTT0_9FLAO
MKKLFLMLLIAFPLLSIAQIKFEPGYFIENESKTECLIKNIAWKNNPTSFEYKLNEADDIKTKNISTVSEFNINESYKFIRTTTNVDRSETALDRLDNSKQPKWNTETIFLKVLVEGKITLYQYEDSNFIKYFFSTENDAKTEQLVYKEYLVDGGVAENNFFRQQLYNLMKDDKFTISRFENLKYKKSDMVKLFAEYNGNSGTKMKNLSEKQNNGKLNLRFTPGITFTSLDIENSTSGFYFDFGSNVSYRIGAEIEYILPFNNNKWSLFADPNYQSYEKDGNRGNQSLSVSYKVIEIPLGVRHYIYLSDKSKIFVDAAYIASLSMGDNNLKFAYSELEVSNTSALALGLGYSYERYSLEARYNFSHGILDNYESWGSNLDTFSVILGYNFL